MNIYEIGALQGWPKSWVDQLLEIQPRSKVGAGFGDAMSLSVLMRVLPRALQSAGLLDKFDDVWEQIPQRGPLPGRLYERDNPIDPKLQPVWTWEVSGSDDPKSAGLKRWKKWLRLMRLLANWWCEDYRMAVVNTALQLWQDMTIRHGMFESYIDLVQPRPDFIDLLSLPVQSWLRRRTWMPTTVSSRCFHVWVLAKSFSWKLWEAQGCLTSISFTWSSMKNNKRNLGLTSASLFLHLFWRFCFVFCFCNSIIIQGHNWQAWPRRKSSPQSRDVYLSQRQDLLWGWGTDERWC